ncbi:hypothetical protein BV898_14746 [Hypsibius exemplaris]|uniref:Chromo domain-containing protein n=1 Tax=Hypsibius exemplaris TaxID=2072580 RepID=A0A9X6NCH7_HYPEX|nr:hypothetical protein BV898_14746 [Hypsibius exemplaris]
MEEDISAGQIVCFGKSRTVRQVYVKMKGLPDWRWLNEEDVPALSAPAPAESTLTDTIHLTIHDVNFTDATEKDKGKVSLTVSELERPIRMPSDRPRSPSDVSITVSELERCLMEPDLPGHDFPDIVASTETVALSPPSYPEDETSVATSTSSGHEASEKKQREFVAVSAKTPRRRMSSEMRETIRQKALARWARWGPAEREAIFRKSFGLSREMRAKNARKAWATKRKRAAASDDARRHVTATKRKRTAERDNVATKGIPEEQQEQKNVEINVRSGAADSGSNTIDPETKEDSSSSLLEESEEIFEVERVLGSSRLELQLWYLIKWRGYNDSFNSWVRASDLKMAKESVDNFIVQYGKAGASNPKVMSPEGAAWEAARIHD